MDKTLQVQLQIRQNAEEISSALKGITGWEKSIKDKDHKIKQGKNIPRRNTSAPASKPSSSTFQARSGGGTVPLRSTTTVNASATASSTDLLTPASIVSNYVSSEVSTATEVPKARGNYEKVDLEVLEREKGNAEFKVGNFTAAVKYYTKCLGIKERNYVAFSNRAMAYLKLKEYTRAIMDCNTALGFEETHVKSLLRRATAFNALGKHRAALKDLLLAVELEPGNKQARQEMQQTKESLRNATQRAPLVAMPSLRQLTEERQLQSETDFIDDIEEVQQGPDLPTNNNNTDKKQTTEEEDLELF